MVIVPKKCSAPRIQTSALWGVETPEEVNHYRQTRGDPDRGRGFPRVHGQHESSRGAGIGGRSTPCVYAKSPEISSRKVAGIRQGYDAKWHQNKENRRKRGIACT